MKQADSLKTQVIKDAAMYIPSSYVAQGLGVVNAFLIRRLLGPTMMGVWATLQILLNYGGYLHLGSMQAGAKEIPFHLGRKDQRMADEITNNIFSFSLLMAALTAALLAVGSILYRRELTPPIQAGLISVGLILIGQRAYNFTVMVLRGHKSFALLSRLTIVTAVLDVALAGILIWLFGIYGLYSAVLGSLVLSILFVWKRLPCKVRFSMDREVLRGVAKIGLPMLLIGLAFTALRTMDKIMVVKYLGATQLGIYSIALMAGNYVFGLSNMVGILTLPRYSEHFGDKGDAQALGKYMDQTNKAMGVVLPVMLGFFYFLAPLLIRLLLPKYVEGIAAMQWMLLGTYFLCLVHQPHNFLMAIGKQNLILPATLAGVAACALFNYWAVTAGAGLVWVALATSASYLITFLLLFVTSRGQLKEKIPVRKAMVQTLLPFAYVALVLWGIDGLFPAMDNWWVLPLQWALFALAVAYPVWGLDRETHLIRKAWGMAVSKWRAA